MAKETIYDKDQQQLVKDLGNRNAKAFEHLFVTRYKGLCRFAHAFVDSYEEAEEVVQDMFARIWEKGAAIEYFGVVGQLFVCVCAECLFEEGGNGSPLGGFGGGKECGV